MKKNLLLILMTTLMVVGSSVSFAATRPLIVLMHNGASTLYDNNKLADAISAAVAGDTIYLSEGAFGGGVTIDKPISIIGAGQKTQIGGNITIDIASNSQMSSRILDAIKVKGDIDIQQCPANLTIRKCWVSARLYLRENANDVYIDRCYIKQLFPHSYTKMTNSINSIISQIGSDDINSWGVSAGFSFVNCNICFCDGSLNGTFINCIVAESDQANNSTFLNCILRSSVNSSSSAENCYDYGISFESGEDGFPELDISNEQIASNSYLGTDGTIVGAYGGETPFSLIPSQAHVSESILEMSADKKTMNVSIKVSTND